MCCAHVSIVWWFCHRRLPGWNRGEEIMDLRSDYVMKTKMFIFKSVHFVLTVGLFYWTWLIFRYNEFPQVKDVGYRYNYLVVGAFALMVSFFNRTYNSYLFGYMRIRNLAFQQLLAQLFPTIVIYTAVSIGWNHWNEPWVFIILLAAYTLFDIAAAYLGNQLYFKLNPPRRTLLIYRNKRDRRRFGSIAGKPTERLYRIEKELQFDGTFEEIRPELEKGYEAVFVAGLNSHCRNGILKFCEEKGIRGFFLPHIGDVIMQGAAHIQSFDSPVMMVRRKTLKPEYRVIKRLTDIVFAATGLILASPILLITAICIKYYDHGPVFYRQVRLTRNEKRFLVTKFSSMRNGLDFA